ncbi:glycosyltransferase family 2 protein [Psychromonas sp. MB-3u-54]|uniref:glycosyltransferase family 2 protein n=1 Tax=Psychromonas sp. MB-3u-54 TaxID=2058319 RepID=UPI0012FE8E52|nr:glycosyltransferase family 2 protein [Psychromonas sp. MB-3u-54]
MKYDVIVAAFNGENFIEEQIDSILNQTIKPENIFIRDDSSTDKTLEVLAKYQQHESVHVIKKGCNLGYIKNFEKLISYIESKYVFFSDQDDVWSPNKAEVMLGELQISGDGLVAFSNACVTDNSLKPIGILWDFVKYSPDQNSLLRVLKSNFVTGATMLVNTAFLNELTPFPEEIPHDYWIATNAVIRGRLIPVDQLLIYYRQHNANVIGIKNKGYYTRLIDFMKPSSSKRRIVFFNEKLSLIKLISKDFDLNDHLLVRYCNFIKIKSSIYRVDKALPFPKLSQFFLYFKISSLKNIFLDVYDYAFMGFIR